MDPRRRHRHRRHSLPSHEPEMQTRLRRILQSGEPLELLLEASEIVELTTNRPADHFAEDKGDAFTLDDLVDGLAAIDLLESSALLAALRTLLPPSPVVDRINGELAAGSRPLPDWVSRIDQIEVVSTFQTRDVLDDGDDIFVTVRSPAGKTMTALVYIDHNMGTVVKDGFVVPVGVEELAASLDQSGETDLRLDFVDGADARTRIEQAIADGDRMLPPFETDTWPRFRPLIEWIVGHLPTGGRGYVRPEWNDVDRRALVDAFLLAPEAGTIAADGDAVDIVRTLIDFACDYGAGDPLRWSPVAVEIFLADWFPRKVIADRIYREKVPDTMRVFIRYCHRERAIPAHLTAETLDAVARWERHTIQPEAMDAGFGLADDSPFEAVMLDILAEDVGGREILDALDDEPVPVEKLDWTGIPDDIHDAVGEVVQLTDSCCEELLDLEYRTIVRRLVAKTAVADPDFFRRKAKVDNTAVAFVWMVGRENDVFRYDFTVKDLRAWFGLKSGSSSQRAQTIRKALGVADPYNDDRLADPGLLHSRKRRALVEHRDRYRAALAAQAEAGPEPATVPGADAAVALAWFPAAVWPEARARFGLGHLPLDHAEYSRAIQAAILEYATRTTGPLGVAPLDIEEMITFAESRGIDPMSEQARSTFAAELHRTGRTIPWPPGRNKPCWCGSGRKYKHCCARPG